MIEKVLNGYADEVPPIHAVLNVPDDKPISQTKDEISNSTNIEKDSINSNGNKSGTALNQKTTLAPKIFKVEGENFVDKDGSSVFLVAAEAFSSIPPGSIVAVSKGPDAIKGQKSSSEKYVTIESLSPADTLQKTLDNSLIKAKATRPSFRQNLNPLNVQNPNRRRWNNNRRGGCRIIVTGGSNLDSQSIFNNRPNNIRIIRVPSN